MESKHSKTKGTKRGTISAAKQFKVILIGDSMVGKTCIIQRFIDNQFVENNGTQPTLAWDFKVKTLQVENKIANLDKPDKARKEFENVRVYVWDTAGQERFRHIARMYYKDVAGVLLCFDLTDEESYKNVNFWLSDLNKHAPEKIVKVLCGNKLDLCQSPNSSQESFDSKREVGYERAYQYALENQMYYYECSAKTGTNVNEIFQKLVNEINELSKKVINMKTSEDTNQYSVLDEAVINRKKLNKKVKKLSDPNKSDKCC